VVDSVSPTKPTEREKLLTLFELGREVTSVLELDELLPRIPELLARIIAFDAFAVFLQERRSGRLRIAYATGYPAEAVQALRLDVGQGLVGTAVAERTSLVVNDLPGDPRYVHVVPGMRSEVVVPLLYKKRPIGALNLLSSTADAYTEEDAALLRQFAVHVAVALENARLFERERRDVELFETLAEIGREFSSILELDELLVRVAQLTRRVVDYRTFGIWLLDPTTNLLEAKVAVKYGDSREGRLVPLGEGIVGHAALYKEVVNVPDVSRDPRYISAVADVRSELAIPMLVKDRCIGVVDLESPELAAYSKGDEELLTLLASQAAVAVENARLYEAVRANEERLEREVRFAQRVQMAFLPPALPRRTKGLDVAAGFEPAHELGGDFYDYLTPVANTFVVAVGDVSGKGVPAALYSAFAGELMRSRTFRRRYTPDRANPAAVLESMNTILQQRQLEEYYCTLCYASFDLKARTVTFANSGLPYPLRFTGSTCSRVVLPGVPLGALPGSVYDELTLPLAKGDVFVFCSDGVWEALDEAGEELGDDRVQHVICSAATQSAAAIVDAVLTTVAEHRGRAVPNDDTTVVAVKIIS
jgi:sigma-B regulation protein RsbU (phosphoserine phosphatase)